PSDSDAGSCATFRRFACGVPHAFASLSPECNFSIGQCAQFCPMRMRPCHAYGASCADRSVVNSHPVIVECALCPGNVGRRPDGFAARAVSAAERSGDPLGTYFAHVARLEAASVHAFDILTEELLAHDAPRALVRSSCRARRDEVRHARAMARLASK